LLSQVNFAETTTGNSRHSFPLCPGVKRLLWNHVLREMARARHFLPKSCL
jgi:hypothetical protein